MDLEDSKSTTSIILNEKSGGTLEAPRGVHQMIGVLQSSADQCATAWESRKSLLVVDLL